MTNKQDLSLEILAVSDKICIIRWMPKNILYAERNACVRRMVDFDKHVEIIRK